MFRTTSVIFAILLLTISLLIAACSNPLSNDKNSSPGISKPEPNSIPDIKNQPKENPYFRLKSNVNSAFTESLKTYLTASLSESYYYRGSGSSKFSDVSVPGNATGTSETAPSADAGGSGAAASVANMSGTNLIVQGVDEADITKSDGQYLYTVKNKTSNYFVGEIGFGGITSQPIKDSDNSTQNEPPSVLIYAINSTTPQVTLTTTIGMSADVFRINGLYLNNNSQTNINELIVLSSTTSGNQVGSQSVTRITTYDLSDPATPTISWTLDIDGDAVNSRLINGKLLLITRQYLELQRLTAPYVSNDTKEELLSAIEKITVNDVLPKTHFNTQAINLVDASDCIVPVSANAQSYFDNELTTIFTIPLTKPETADAICTLESSGEIYVSAEALYMTKNDYIADAGEGTLIHKFALNDSGLAYRASGRVPGTIGWRNNAFRMSEYQDYFRVITSISQSIENNTGSPFWRANDQTHHLFILKEDKTSVGQLSIVSQLPNKDQPAAIGKPRENIYGVRFNGDYGYVVTFKKVDPLYVLNLVNPEAPFIEGELELPGYSDYLHPVNQNILIGIGKDAIEENGTAFYQGIKVGIFDITDKTNPQVLQEVLIGKRGTNSDALNEHHAFTYFNNTETGVIRFAFPVSIHDGEPAYFNNDSASTYYNWQLSGLQLFQLSESNGIYNLSNDGVLAIESANSGKTNNFYFQEPRALFVNDAVFLTNKGDVWTSNWFTPEIVTTTVNQDAVNVTGHLSFTIGDPPNAGGESTYHMSIRDAVSFEVFDIEYPSTVADNFMKQTNPFGKLISVSGSLISASADAPRKIRLNSMELVE